MIHAQMNNNDYILELKQEIDIIHLMPPDYNHFVAKFHI